MRLVSGAPAKKETAFHSIARRFCLANHALPHFHRKSPACLPSTVYKVWFDNWRCPAENLYLVG